MNKFQYLKSYAGRMWLYNRGTIPAVIGDWLAYEYTGTATLYKNSSNLSLVLSSSRGWAYGQNQIDLTNIDTLYFYGSSSSSSAVYHFAVTQNNGGLTNDASVLLPISGVNALVSIDVSALSGNYYVRFGRFGTSNATNTITCYEVYGV